MHIKRLSYLVMNLDYFLWFAFGVVWDKDNDYKYDSLLGHALVPNPLIREHYTTSKIHFRGPISA
jgi:hypothetical protein